MSFRTFPRQALVVLGLAATASVALADINVGVTVSATGPAASLGIPEKNTAALLPTTVAGPAAVPLNLSPPAPGGSGRCRCAPLLRIPPG